ncbi:ATP F0F1 synthase subunit B [Arsukibacterium ikkense]|uniref:ATP synthase subunit b n=1 Tax=Arsukibacterium ikkense TaxID=336831 RepID=A0A0M2V6A0_9GAMM|nr:F0F1 ATP synthase subunit B [Arsukibacterium ikkense]KKO45944.1 ATP F0F1 synthase subunit B [Arsukibacterium ikkense]
MNLTLTIIGQMIAFAAFVLFCMKLVWPPLMNAIEARQQKIAHGLAATDRAEKDLALAQDKAKDQLKDAKAQAAAIIEQAKKREAKIIEEAADKANAEREHILAQAKAEVEAEGNRLREDLRKQVAALAIAGAEKILQRSIDEAAHSDILEKLVQEL